MSVREWLAQLDPVLTAGAAFLTAVTAFGAWVARAWHRERAYREARRGGLAGRWDDATGANKRLFESLEHQIDELARRCEECEADKLELQRQHAELRGIVIRQSAAIDIMRSVMEGSGMRIPPLPVIDAAAEDMPPG